MIAKKKTMEDLTEVDTKVDTIKADIKNATIKKEMLNAIIAVIEILINH